MKKYLFSILFVLFVALAGCQNNKSFGVWNYIVEEQADEQAMMLTYFTEVQHDKPIFLFVDEEPLERQIGDTLFYVLRDRDTIYVYNSLSYYTRKIPVKNKIIIGGIESVYYHNHDSVFIFLRQPFVQNYLQRLSNSNGELYDVILINGQGDSVSSYHVEHPLKYAGIGSREHTLFPANKHIMGTRVWGEELLIRFVPWAHCFDKDYAKFDPPMMAMYNLKTGNCRMLNIHFPSEYFGKKYGSDDAIWDVYWILPGKQNDLFVFFEFTPVIYHYDFEKDTMTEWQCQYDKVLTTTDSASMQYGDMVIRYDVPRWCKEEKCYFRQMEIIAYKNYRRGTIVTQIMDTDFNHVAYVIKKHDSGFPYSYAGMPMVYCNKDKQYHRICISRKLRQMKMKDLEKNMISKPIVLKDTITMTDYFHRLHIPDSHRYVLIVNMKYPCCTCYDFIFGTMRYNKETFEKNNIYLVSYDPNGTDFLMKGYIEKYGLTNMPNLIKDTTMLESVYGGGMCWGNYPYVLATYSNGKCILQYPEFATLQKMLTEIVKEQIEWKYKGE